MNVTFLLLGDGARETLLVRRKCQIVSVSRIGAIMLGRQVIEVDVQDMTNDVGNHR